MSIIYLGSQKVAVMASPGRLHGAGNTIATRAIQFLCFFHGNEFSQPLPVQEKDFGGSCKTSSRLCNCFVWHTLIT